MNNCKDCKHWGQITPNAKLGDCSKLNLDSSITSDADVVPISNSDIGDEFADIELMTGMNFGCIHFEQK